MINFILGFIVGVVSLVILIRFSFWKTEREIKKEL